MIKIDGVTFLRASELCQFLDISYPTLRKYRREGRIEGVKVGKRWVYNSQDIKNFLSGGVAYFNAERESKTGSYKLNTKKL